MSHHPGFPDTLENKYVLLLDSEEYRFIQGLETTGYGTWVATNANLAPEKTFRFRDEYNTLKIAPVSEAVPPATLTEFSITHSPKAVPRGYEGDFITFFAWFYTFATCFITIEVADSNGTSVTGSSVPVPANTWTLVRGGELEIFQQSQPPSYHATVNFESKGGLQHVHMAHPVLTNSYGFARDVFLRETLPYIPRFLVDTDYEQTEPKYPMLRLAELGLGYGDRGYRQALSFRYKDLSEGFNEADDSTKSTLVDPTVADPAFLPWLAQFVGVSFTNNVIGGTTAWERLPATWDALHLDIDPDADVTYNISSVGTGTLTTTASPTGISIGDTVSISGTTNFNGQFLVTNKVSSTLTLDPAISATTENVGTVTLVDTSWLEIETFDTQDSNFVSTRRQLIAFPRTGHGAGTEQAISEAVKVILTGTKTISIVTDPVEAPWTIFIRTLVSETPNGVIGTSSQTVIDEANSVKPMGFKIEHECVDLVEFNDALYSYNSTIPYDGFTV